ncbi:MAG: AIR synthase-related protein, partial [Pseudomonadota bacterium]
ILPSGTSAKIDAQSWEWPAIFQWLQANGDIETAEMHRTFNCGIGMVIVVAEQNAETALKILNDNGEQAVCIGEIVADTTDGLSAEERVIIQ